MTILRKNCIYKKILSTTRTNRSMEWKRDRLSHISETSRVLVFKSAAVYQYIRRYHVKELKNIIVLYYKIIVSLAHHLQRGTRYCN